MNTARFSTILGDEYNLLREAYPHHDEFQAKVGEIISDFLEGYDGEEIVVLEGGSGTGVSTLSILNASPKVRVLAVDNEEKMHNQAKEILEENSARVEFILDDLLTYIKSLADSSIDIFVQVWTLHNLDEQYRLEVFQELLRVMKPGGLFISADKYAVDDELEHQRLLEYQLDMFRKYKNEELAEAWVKHNIEDDEIKMVETLQLEQLGELGFKDPKVVYREKMEAILTANK